MPDRFKRYGSLVAAQAPAEARTAMHERKPGSDTAEAALRALRTASRTRSQRLRAASGVVAFLCLLLFLSLALLAAWETWTQMQAPAYFLPCFAVLAAALQRVLGLIARRGRLRRPRVGQATYWALLTGSTFFLLMLLAGGVL